VSLRILFADDSVTAQNMGKKILTEAGYEVVAVSNGAAAVKKIAEQKPDIIILDVYMPGYSGLEVCEKVRGSMETAKTPVLLTVGKMEPYKPEDANRVKADGVIVKPFEASDLLAIVKKFEERIRRMPAPVQQPVLMERFPDQEDLAPELPVEHSMASPTPQPTVEVPDHMATTSAFSDLLGADASHSVNDFQAAPSPPAYRAPAVPAAHRPPVPDYELPVSWRDRDEPEFEVPAPAASMHEAAASEPELENEDTPAYPPPTSRPLQIPVYQEREGGANAYEVMPTAAPPTGDIEIPREPELQESAAEATRSTIVEDIAPGLIPSLQQFLQHEAEQASRAKKAADLASIAAAPPAGPKREQAADEPVSNANFEGHVAAAMSASSRSQDAQAVRTAAPVSEPTAAGPGVPEHPAGVGRVSTGEFVKRGDDQVSAEAASAAVEYYPPVREMAVPAPRIASQPAQPETEEVPTPTFEYHPPVSAPMEVPASEARWEVAPGATQLEQEVAPAETRQAAETQGPEPPGLEGVDVASQQAAMSEPAPGSEIATSDNHVSAPSSMEASALAAAVAAGAQAGTDPGTIAQAVHRVMERLKPELVDEIVRELKSKK
jgi:CheY-like chemotaxis protein